jgi:hypothetical protein
VEADGEQALLMSDQDIQVIRDEFLRLLTVSSETQDGRRKEFNQAIFDPEEGWAVFNGTDLDMVMEKFDKAVKNIYPQLRMKK